MKLLVCLPVSWSGLGWVGRGLLISFHRAVPPAMRLKEGPSIPYRIVRVGMGLVVFRPHPDHKDCPFCHDVKVLNPISPSFICFLRKDDLFSFDYIVKMRNYLDATSSTS